MSTPFGFEAVLYFYSAPRAAWVSGAAPTGLLAVNNIQDATCSMGANKGDVSIRGSAFKRTKPGMHDIKLELEMLWNTQDPRFNTLRAAYIARTTVAALALDGDAASVGSQGWAADWSVTELSRPEPLENPLKCKVVMEIGPDVDIAVPPQYIIVGT